MRYIPTDVSKCEGNPALRECKDCLRRILPVHPESISQWYMGAWVMEDEPCPSRWTERSERESNPAL